VHPGSALICVLVFFIVFLLSRYVSLGSLCAAVVFPVAVMLVFRESSGVLRIFSWVLCVMVFYTHRHNIVRLWKNRENRMDLFGRSSART
jgi:glycerol-3-phosphate acyltransferase PlsY